MDIRKMICWATVVTMVAGVRAADFQHELSGVKPWTSEQFLDDPQEFHFAVIPDRTGGERKGFFGKAMDSLNLLRPEFVMSVGDLVDGGGVPEPVLRAQWSELESFIARLQMPFFYVVGNHDIWTGFSGMTPARETAITLWKERHGENPYYSFMYNGCLFVCLNSMETANYFPPREALSESPLEWAAQQFEKHPEARWRFIFMHKPLDWTSDRWLKFERRILKYDYTVFCGDWHNHCKAVRNGKNYYMIGTAGGTFDRGVTRDDLRYGIMDSVTWVTMTKKGPVVANLALSGIYGDEIQRCATTQGWIEAPLDYPSHLAEDPAKYSNEKNTALIPAEVMEGPGYDWHFRHAVILRQGCCYAGGLNKFAPGKRRVALLGDETASAKAVEYEKDSMVIDLGFKGDRTQNVLWRIIQGELKGYDPHLVVISAGRHNRGLNTAAEIDAACARIVALVRERCPKAKILLEQ
jgi:hypothetical protein